MDETLFQTLDVGQIPMVGMHVVMGLLVTVCFCIHIFATTQSLIYFHKQEKILSKNELCCRRILPSTQQNDLLLHVAPLKGT